MAIMSTPTSGSYSCFLRPSSVSTRQPPGTRSSFPTCRTLHRRSVVSASISQSPSTSPPSSTDQPLKTQQQLPLRDVPGDLSIPIWSPVQDRLDYFYRLGKDEFFRSRVQRHGSTVVRLHMPPGPLITFDSAVVALLDAKSFPVLFDMDKVDKTSVFTGTYMPSTNLTGGHRTVSYLDPSEPKHAQLKGLVFYLLMSSKDRVIPRFGSVFGSMFETMEAKIREGGGKADFAAFAEEASFEFLAQALLGVDSAASAGLKASDAPGLITKWVLFQLSPLLSLGLPSFIEDVLLRNIRLPFFLIKNDYQRLLDFFSKAASPVLDEAERMGIPREEATHNLLFTVCFNTWGGMKIFFPSIIKSVAAAGTDLHSRLAEEVRSAVATIGGGAVTLQAIEQGMPLLKSVVYEALRIDPPVPLQYGRAKQDLVIESHDAAFRVRKGEMLFGYQPFATKDARVFDRPEEFVPERFMGEEGEALLEYVYWSNGRETERPTKDNKQCAGKDFVVLMSRLLLVQLFLQYDSLDVEIGTSPLGSSVSITSLKNSS